MTTPALSLENVRFAYGPDGAPMMFDTAIPAGSLSAVMGPSGSGKSTFFALIAGFEQPQAGRIHINGEDVTTSAPSERPISYVFQENNLFSHLDVMTNVGLGIDPRRRLSGDDRGRVSQALERVGLSGFEMRLPASLSGGERQRVALARALVRKRPMLLLDEPFAALGPRLRDDMLALVKALHEEAGLTTLMITHQPSDARAIADRVVFIDRGSIAANAPTDNLFDGTDLPAWNDYLGLNPTR
ncbi:thiamine ABC transporter ATP-binding protein [Pararhizobium haloflavum]|uniref:thiamine ABC transporter ATP-binding protein n=1 Tax=Pararhizobium haloflavum TaxID=2037914 RepID=UPI000C1A5F4B|nr:thiamine ABC transporter ATP-binding protein [Pararhizobium haloflavum]